MQMHPSICLQQQTEMIIVLITALLFTVQNKWIQQGQWHCFNQKNDSQIFNLLSINHGKAQIRVQSRNKEYLSLQLKNERQENMLGLDVWMKNSSFSTEAVYRLTQVTIGVKLFRQRRSEVTYNFNHILFNLTLIHRERIYLNSTQGDFVIELVDLEALFPYFTYQLFAVWASSTFVVMIISVYAIAKQAKFFTSILGQLSAQMLLLWNIRALSEIMVFERPYFVSESESNDALFAFTVLTLGIEAILAFFFIIERRIIKMNICRQRLRLLFIVTLQIACMLRLVFGFQDQITLLFVLGIVQIYQIQDLVSSKPNHLETEPQIWVLHFALYLFPIGIFPYYHQQINYPKAEADLWWAYILLYALDAIVFYLKSNGGTFLRLKYYLRRCRVSKIIYEQLKEDACPICLKPIEFDISNASGASINVQDQNAQVVLHSCNHYFHKACINDVAPIQRCFFDNEKWYSQQQMKKTQKKNKKYINE